MANIKKNIENKASIYAILSPNLFCFKEIILILIIHQYNAKSIK